MEQITRKGGYLYYGDTQCCDGNEAYRLFRSDYHRSLGKNVHGRLGRLGSRKERVHDSGSFFRYRPSDDGLPNGRVPVYLLGILAGAYCKVVDRWDLPEDLSERDFFRWVDLAFMPGSGRLRMAGTKHKLGRTSRQRKRYR